MSISPSSVAPPANMQEEQIIPGNWDALITEIRAAVNRLKPAGLDQNFLRLTLTPEAPYFTDASLRKIVENRLRLAGEFCRKTGLRGIAIDTQSQNEIYDYRWAGYPVSSSTEILTQGARQFGKEILRAFIRACPEGEILLLAQSPELSGPLWFPFLEGVLESTGAATTIQIHLVLNDNNLPKSVESYKNHPQRMRSMFQQRLSTTSFNRWEHQGSIVFSLDPIRYQDDIPTARYPLPKYRRALYATTLYGNAYTLISARQGGWWHIPPDLATQFKHLHQGGNARVSFAPPVPTTLEAYAPRIDISDAIHIGNIPINGEVLEVLKQKGKIKLLAWNGLSKGLC
ncbi:MAG: hypothetical protein KAH38_11860, partial [Candidatus Hydrogenedentes bacterium]|nr:hypothetical protein [Candidatus Hydrogenedentota bacterium]